LNQAKSAVTSTVEQPLRETPSEQLSEAFCEEGKFAVAFLDNQMSVMGGLMVVERLRKLNSHDFIVGIPGNASLLDQNEYYSAGVDRILTKPILERHLREILVEADERRKARLVLEVGPPGILPHHRHYRFRYTGKYGTRIVLGACIL